jgi:hypothetical protein
MGEKIYEFPQLSEKTNLIAIDSMRNTLESKIYLAGKSAEWIDQINGNVIERLRNISSNFKYIVSSTIIQKVGAGLHYEYVSHWDSRTDGAVTAKFENETMLCLCTIIGVAI